MDISSLNTVYMRNVPPTPANYAQRSGRAGHSCAMAGAGSATAAVSTKVSAQVRTAASAAGRRKSVSDPGFALGFAKSVSDPGFAERGGGPDSGVFTA